MKCCGSLPKENTIECKYERNEMALHPSERLLAIVETNYWHSERKLTFTV